MINGRCMSNLKYVDETVLLVDRIEDIQAIGDCAVDTSNNYSIKRQKMLPITKTGIQMETSLSTFKYL